MADLETRLDGYPATRALCGAVLGAWPEHRPFLTARFALDGSADLGDLEDLALNVERIVGPDMERFVRGYRWMCDAMLEEELYFRRHGRYRLSSFDDAETAVYGNAETMELYMNGLLLSQVLWSNHARSLLYGRDVYLPGNVDGYRHLEIGPGHGLFSAFVAKDPRCARAEGWDISATSIAETTANLEALGLANAVTLRQRDVQAPVADDEDRFDSIAIYEVLEHLEDPARVLKAILGLLRPGGRLCAGVPINSPAPDHIYLLRTPQEVADLVRGAGFEIVDEAAFPISGHTFEAAMRAALTVSCVVVARRPQTDAPG